MEVEKSAMSCFSDSKATPTQQPSSTNPCFDCSICLDFAVEPVVTLCGHLYCWPCIYKWLQVETESSSHQCPVCKAPLSQSTLVPLYGRGRSSLARKADIPNRPASVPRDVVNHHPPFQQHHHHHHYHYASPWATGVSQSSAAGGVLGGLALGILDWANGRNYDNREVYLSRMNRFPLDGYNMRHSRQEIRAQTCLQQLWLLLFSCAVLCFLFF